MSAIEDKKRYLLHWMYDFIEDDEEPAYLAEDVEECDQLLSRFLEEVLHSKDNTDFSWMLIKIHELVISLNHLNEKHAHQLIEADQSEDLCALIALVLEQCGHRDKGDITAAWRTW